MDVQSVNENSEWAAGVLLSMLSCANSTPNSIAVNNMERDRSVKERHLVLVNEQSTPE